ncbi:MAG: Pr6Pr family membrane protein [Micrococcus sp.]|nr:Pr6Pr family membrane protein [Micrococcus sp.]
MTASTPRVSLPSNPSRLARAAFWGAGVLPLIGCVTSFSIGASKPTMRLENVGYAGGFEAGWAHAVNQPAYFTWFSNALVAVTTLTLAAKRSTPVQDSFWAARTAGLGSVVITGLVYNTVLRGHEQDTALYRFNDTLQHIVNPLLAPLVWAAFDPRGQITVRRAALGAALPLTWAAITLARGARIDWYPYPFLDVPRLGYRTVGLTLTGILGAFVTTTATLSTVDARLSRRVARGLRRAVTSGRR